MENINDSSLKLEKKTVIKEDFIKSFYRLIKIVRIHHENNQSVINAASKFVQNLELAGKDTKQVSIKFMKKRIYLQNEKLIYHRKNINLYDNIYEYFEKRELDGICFASCLKKISLKQILEFIRLLHYADQQNSPCQWLEQQLKKSNYKWLKILQSHEKESKKDTRKERARKTYSYALASVKEVSQKLSTQNKVGIHKTLRMSQNMVDLMTEDEPLFMVLSTIRFYDDYTFSHSVNVAILAMCIGKRINLSKKSLERLGLCGLLHDLGKIEVPKNILNKPDKLTFEEFEEIKKHTLHSVRLIAKIKASRDRKAKLLLPPFEHHLKYDLSGYPKTQRKTPITLFSRIMTIADVYDAITSPRVYRSSVLSPDQALGMMLKGMGTDFDPILFKIFVNMMGVYPVGTLLKLDKGGIGLVVEASKNLNGARPQILVLKSDGKGDYLKGNQINLDEKDPETGKYKRNIVQTFHPLIYNIQPADFLI